MERQLRAIDKYAGLAVKDEYNTLFTTIILVWGVLDTVTTYVGIAIHNTVRYEINPFVRHLFDVHPSSFLILKTITITAVLLVAVKGKHHIQDVKGWKEYLSSIMLLGFCIIAMNMFSIIIGVRLYF